MIEATRKDKNRIIEILTFAFRSNASVNFITGNGSDRLMRICDLMDYAFEVCFRYGKVVLSEDRNACALVLFPEKKGLSFRSLWLDVWLVFKVVRASGLFPVLRREKLIKLRHPSADFFYLWFIGVHPDQQGLGLGSALLREVLDSADGMNRPVYLETSTLVNIPWYKRFGFSVFDELDLGYKLSFLKRAVHMKNL